MFPNATPEPELTFGQRVKRRRERNGQTRAVVAGLIGRSPEWVKSIENGRLRMPRLPLLLSLADVLGVTELADLTGEERLSASTYTKAAHPALPAVKNALTAYRLTSPGEEPEPADELAGRVRHAWMLWHGSRDHRTRVADVLPALLADLQHAARHHDGRDRRRVLSGLAQAYHLAQLYLSFQPAPELVMLTGDRAMAAAQDADNPHAVATAAWYMNHVFRDAGERHEARVDLAMTAAGLLSPGRGPEDLARWGLLHLAAALSYAKVGRAGDAWRHWDRAEDAARRLGDGYAHPYLVFGQGMVDAYAITMHADLMQGASGAEVADRVDLELMPSATRRSFHLCESARAYRLRGEDVAVVHLLRRAYEESPETARFNLFARGAVSELSASAPAVVRGEVQDMVRKLGVAV